MNVKSHSNTHLQKCWQITGIDENSESLLVFFLEIYMASQLNNTSLVLHSGLVLVIKNTNSKSSYSQGISTEH